MVDCFLFQPREKDEAECRPIDKFPTYHIKEWGRVSGEEDMQAEIYRRGVTTVPWQHSVLNTLLTSISFADVHCCSASVHVAYHLWSGHHSSVHV